MIIPVHMLAFMDKGNVREVEIDDSFQSSSNFDILDEVFRMGQNDFQSKQMPSISVGDVIELGGNCNYWIVAPVGFMSIEEEEFKSLPGHLTREPEFMAKLYEFEKI